MPANLSLFFLVLVVRPVLLVVESCPLNRIVHLCDGLAVFFSRCTPHLESDRTISSEHLAVFDAQRMIFMRPDCLISMTD